MEVDVLEKEKNANKTHMNLMQLTIITGLVAGILGSLIGFFAHTFKFTDINPDLILAPFQGEWKEGWLGIVIATLLYGIISIVVALLYYFTLRKQKSIIWGAVFGAVIFLLLYFVLYPIIPGLDQIWKYPLLTIVTEVCFFILYGIFIGYSISYEYQEQQYWEKIKLEQQES